METVIKPIVALLLGLLSSGCASTVVNQTTEDTSNPLSSTVNAEPEWRWSDNRCEIMTYLLRGSKKYDVALLHRADANLPRLTVVISQGNSEVYSWPSHENDGFIIEGDTLVYSVHDSMVSGCNIVAV